MLVNDQNFTTIWYEDDLDKVKIIDQRLLPHEFKIITLNSLTDAAFAIKEMQVRGAPLIGVTAAYGMYLAALSVSDELESSFMRKIDQAVDMLRSSRPTAVAVKWTAVSATAPPRKSGRSRRRSSMKSSPG